MSYTEADSLRARADFPALTRSFNAQPIAYLDGPGGTQVPEQVLAAIRHAYIERNANFGGMFDTSIAVTSALADARDAVANFLGAETNESISFGANMTTLNFSLAHALRRSMRRGDEIIISELDHEANRGPWLKLKEHGIVVHEIRLQANGQLDLDHMEQLASERTKVVALGLASNSLGTVTSLARARALCDTFGAYLVVDAVHYAAHFPLNVAALNVDFLLCSAYKFYGPHVGILYARKGLLDTLDTDHLRAQKSIAPYRIETGTLNHAAIAGVTAAIDYLATWGDGATRRAQIVSAMESLHRYEFDLARYYFEAVEKIPGVAMYGPRFGDEPRAPTVSIAFSDHVPESVAKALAGSGLQVWHGHFYALKVLDVLGLANNGGLLRVGISMYNTQDEIDRLLSSLQRIVGN